MPGTPVMPFPVHPGMPHSWSSPTINVFMSQQVGADLSYSGHGEPTGGLSVPLLISAISNILVGLFWLATLLGVVLAIPMFILCVFEFVLFSRIGNEPVVRSARSAKTLAIFEIVVGLFNLPTMICGIVLLINASSVASRSRKAAMRTLPQQMPYIGPVQSPQIAGNMQRRVPPPPRKRP